ncbi:MAG: dephospho-CoA kinase [Muribaculaceae bacterium]|nr:dephospho-CoA kinase [Muribaculaceae bacterium]
MSKVIAVCGGIGSGKSVVCEVLRVMGHPVYDCDSEARAIMDSDISIKLEIFERIDSSCIIDGDIDRPRLSEIVFSDPEKLNTLNSIVHSAVKRHLSSWIDSQKSSLIFVETAILYQSGLDRMVDEVWEVTAPVSVRVSRVMRRNSLSEHQVLARIESQDTFEPESLHPEVHVIVNDGVCSLLLQIENLLANENCAI